MSALLQDFTYCNEHCTENNSLAIKDQTEAAYMSQSKDQLIDKELSEGWSETKTRELFN